MFNCEYWTLNIASPSFTMAALFHHAAILLFPVDKCTEAPDANSIIFLTLRANKFDWIPNCGDCCTV
jgi:hypothetical protein